MELAAEFLKQQDVDIAFAEVDCTMNDSLCVGMTAYPTIGVFHGRTNADKFAEFNGDRSAAHLVSFASNGTVSMRNLSVAATTTTIRYTRPTVTTPPPNPFPDSIASNAILLLNDGKEALVKLELPGLAWTTERTNDTLPSSCVLLDFNITDDGQHLSLGGRKLALTVPDPSIPQPPLVDQVDCDYDFSWIDSKIPLHQQMSQYTNNKSAIGIDYAIDARNRDDPNIRYYNYHPQIYLDIIGAKNLLLDMPTQQTLEIKLHVKNQVGSMEPGRDFQIDDIVFHNRPSNYRVPGPFDRTCSLWSYRCADIGDPPWYKYVWRSNFDKYGRIGSSRRVLVIWWRTLMHMIPWPFWILAYVAVIAGLILRSIKKRAESRDVGLPLYEKRSKA
ncbi:hypothetical protein DOTSEDRAFT_41665 [Dothistroma septosporum NZE10]|uniref:Thioredoxin domain-containing protein n=1 Tax=Dothistroma septosporum (strain NZE10 / CBS 128990) TaxID=675120 RepID=N1PYC0_DOTSN|nr:hypothetical protein DOTSEDRAFT_41665 [Dothistroma septosporum NZE10]